MGAYCCRSEDIETEQVMGKLQTKQIPKNLTVVYA